MNVFPLKLVLVKYVWKRQQREGTKKQNHGALSYPKHV